MVELIRPDKWLFVCSANIARSPTAEYLARKRGLFARSCGTAGKPRMENGIVVTPLTHEILKWADVIVCMKEGYRLAIEVFGHSPSFHGQKVFVWDLTDKWHVPYHPEMIEIMEPLLLQSLQEYDEWQEKAGRPADIHTS